MTESQLQESLQRLADAITVLTTSVGALVTALLNKGVITEAEYNRGEMQATSILDQEFARKRDTHANGGTAE